MSTYCRRKKQFKCKFSVLLDILNVIEHRNLPKGTLEFLIGNCIMHSNHELPKTEWWYIYLQVYKRKIMILIGACDAYIEKFSLES